MVVSRPQFLNVSVLRLHALDVLLRVFGTASTFALHDFFHRAHHVVAHACCAAHVEVGPFFQQIPQFSCVTLQ